MVKELGPGARHLYSSIASVVGQELLCDEATVRRNAAYALGRLFQHGGAQLLFQHPALSKVHLPSTFDHLCIHIFLSLSQLA